MQRLELMICLQRNGSTQRHGPRTARLLMLLLISFCPILALAQEDPLSDTDVLLASADEVLAAVARLRQLEPKQPVEKGIKSKEEIEAFLVKRIEEEYPAEDIESEERLLSELGLIPKDLRLYPFMLSLLTEQIAGLYDPESKTFFIADWIPVEIQKPVMAHELTHALQDQYFGLEKYLDRIEGNDDQAQAISALIEGECLLVMLDYTFEQFGRIPDERPDILALNRAQMPMIEAQFPIFARAPLYLRETLMFPYTYGGSFIQQYLQQHSWSDVSNMYEDLPRSTEQILHPEKYYSKRDDPQTIETSSVRSMLDASFSLVTENVLGEFSIYLLLRQFLSEEKAIVASEGWDGDLVELFEDSNGRTLLQLRTEWDSPLDAEEFFEAYSALILRKYPNAVATPSSAKAPRKEEKVWQDSTRRITLTLYQTSVCAEETERTGTP